jgi:hypothetical protein
MRLGPLSCNWKSTSIPQRTAHVRRNVVGNRQQHFGSRRMNGRAHPPGARSSDVAALPKQDKNRSAFFCWPAGERSRPARVVCSIDVVAAELNDATESLERVPSDDAFVTDELSAATRNIGTCSAHKRGQSALPAVASVRMNF